jgi:proline dehydrogenase
MTTFAIKLTSLNIADPKHDYLKVLDDVHHICDLAIENSSKVIIDAEQVSINDTIDEVSDLMMETYNKSNVNIYKTYQMYRRDTMSKYLQDLKEERDYFIGAKIVRGAYYNEDIDTDLLFSQIEHTHQAYDDAIRYFTENSSSKDKLLCATHNFISNDIAKNHIHNGKKNIEIGHLLGMADYLSDELVQEGVPVYKYIPFGEFNETLPYLSRRLYENYPLIKHM